MLYVELSAAAFRSSASEKMENWKIVGVFSFFLFFCYVLEQHKIQHKTFIYRGKLEFPHTHMKGKGNAQKCREKSGIDFSGFCDFCKMKNQTNNKKKFAQIDFPFPPSIKFLQLSDNIKYESFEVSWGGEGKFSQFSEPS